MRAQFGDDRLPGRFWDKVEVDEATGCWKWRASLNSGYGQFMLDKKPRLAHRLVYETILGEVPAGLELDHLCRVRCCCNPAHLEPVTGSENVRRGVVSVINTLRALKRTHCPKGHPLSGDNLYVSKRQRHCRECGRKASLDYQRRKRAERA